MMNTLIQKTTWMCAGLLLALTCGMPAVADDTELLLINPDTAQTIPNVMLIIDSSPGADARGVRLHAGIRRRCDALRPELLVLDRVQKSRPDL
jgi:hypothetical protein